MPTEPYLKSKPGDLITAENMNQMQIKIREDIPLQAKAEVDKLKSVDMSRNAEKLGGKSVEQITQEIVDLATAKLAKDNGYRQVFRRLKVEESVVEHKLQSAPLTDVYQLEYFPAVTLDDEIKRKESVLFYLYHTDESSISVKGPGDVIEDVEIEPADGPAFKISWESLIARYFADVKGLDGFLDKTIAELETEFWKRFLGAPSEKFREDQIAHSIWFEKCCGQKRKVRELRDDGAFNDLWLKMQPVKTENVFAISVTTLSPTGVAIASNARGMRPLVRVRHLDFDKTGFKAYTTTSPAVAAPPLPELTAVNHDPLCPAGHNKELPVMILFKA